MLGFVWLTPFVLLGFVSLLYFIDMWFPKVLASIPLLNMMSGRFPKTASNTLIALLLVVSGAVSGGFISVSAITNYTSSDASTVGTTNADIALLVNNGSNSAFDDTGYSFILLDYSTYASTDASEILSEIKDYGTGDLVGPNEADPIITTVSSGTVTFSAVTAEIGDQFIVFGYDDTVPASGDNEIMKEVIKITSYNPENAKFGIDNNRFTLNTYATMDSYNFAGTDVSGYTDDEDAAKADTEITFSTYPNANYNISVDAGLYFETTSTMISNINYIKVYTDDGLYGTYSSFQSVANMDPGDVRAESAPAKQSDSNYLYYVDVLPDTERTSSTNLGKIDITVGADHPGTGTNNIYLYGVELVNSGSDFHFDFGSNPLFNYNLTASGTDGWNT